LAPIPGAQDPILTDTPDTLNPPEGANPVATIAVEDELKRSYLDYAMSVIVQRALPDALDGLNPEHRRILYSMQEIGGDWNKPYG
jgi:DNA gyrase subunit A